MFLFNCDNATNPEEIKDASVVCILRNHLNQQTALVYYTSPDKIDDIHDVFHYKSDESKLFADDAEVKISTGENEYQFEYFKKIIPDENYYDEIIQKFICKSDDFVVKPKKSYNLFVETDAGIIRGSTQVPQDINIQIPEDSATVYNRQVKVKWNKIDGSDEYYLKVLGLRYKSKYHNSVMYYWGSSNATTNNYYKFSLPDTTGYSQLENRIPLDDPPRFVIKVMAIDTNLYNHFNGAIKAGIEGGYGVFGSATVDSVEIFLE